MAAKKRRILLAITCIVTLLALGVWGFWGGTYTALAMILTFIIFLFTLAKECIETHRERSRSNELFKLIADYWHLDWGRGEEDLRIDEEGRYFVFAFDKQKPAIILKHVEWDPQLRAIRWLKVRVKGYRGKPQEETLTLSEDCNIMKGYPVHEPNRRLIYTRRVSE